MTDSEFNLDSDVLYLNHAAVSPWPRRTVDAVRQFATENGQRGSQQYPQWLQRESALREQFRELINAQSCDEIALLKSTSEALSVIAWGLNWAAGDRIVYPAQEFPSNRIVWESLRTLGVTTSAVDISATDDPEQALIDALAPQTRLLSVSAVQYADGLVLDVNKLGAACKARGILFCVDAIQCLGALPFDVQACQADFVAADGHKWLLGPEGLALFYCRQPLIKTLRLNQFGWHMVEAMGDFDRTDWAPAESARRFECGSPNMLGIHALHASLSLLLDTGMQQVARRLRNNTRYLIDQLQEHTEILSPQAELRRAGIVTVRTAGEDTEARYRHLQNKGVVCALRGGGIRFSPHYYTAREVLDRAIEYFLEPLSA